MTHARSTRWQRFAAALASSLSALQEDQYLVIVRKDRPWFVEFEAQGAHGFRAELVSNATLEGDDRLPEAAFDVALGLGWSAPSEEPEAAARELEPGVHNYVIEWDQPVPFSDIARVTVDTFIDVLATPNPDLLCYRAFTDQGDTILLPTLGLRMWTEEPDTSEVTPDPAAVREALLALLRAASGNPELEPDEDGDLPLGHGDSVVFVRVLEDPLIVRVFAPVLSDTEGGRDLHDAINDLNLRFPFTKWFREDDTIITSIDLFTQPLVEQHVLNACALVGKTIDGVVADLQERFGGRTFLGERVGRKQSDTSLGYL